MSSVGCSAGDAVGTVRRLRLPPALVSLVPLSLVPLVELVALPSAGDNNSPWAGDNSSPWAGHDHSPSMGDDNSVNLKLFTRHAMAEKTTNLVRHQNIDNSSFKLCLDNSL